jgi:thioredoxin
MKAFYLPLTICFLLLTGYGYAQKVVSPSEFQSMVNDLASVQLIDVRTPGEYAGGSLMGAQNIDVRSNDFNERIETLDRNQPVFVYCLSGGRSANAAKQMVSMGFTDIYDLKGGIMSWKRVGLPVKMPDAAQPTGMTRQEYDKALQAQVPVLVNFFAPWCGPCRKMKPMLDELNQSAADKSKYMPLNADENDALIKSLNVTEIPSFFIYQDGKQTWKHIGLVDKEMLIDQLGL